MLKQQVKEWRDIEKVYKSYMKLTKKQRLYIDFALSHPTYSDSAISKEIETSTVQIYKWKKNPEFVEEYNKALKERWNSYSNEAQTIMHGLLHSAKDEVALRAAQYILDSTGYKATDKVELDANVNEKIIKVDIIDDD